MKNYSNKPLNQISLKVIKAIELIKKNNSLLKNIDYSITSLFRENDTGSHGNNKAVDIIIDKMELLPLLSIELNKIFKDKANIFLKYGSLKQHIHIDEDYSKGHKGYFAWENPDGKSLIAFTDKNIKSGLLFYIPDNKKLLKATEKELNHVKNRSLIIYIILIIIFFVITRKIFK